MKISCSEVCISVSNYNNCSSEQIDTFARYWWPAVSLRSDFNGRWMPFPLAATMNQQQLSSFTSTWDSVLSSSSHRVIQVILTVSKCNKLSTLHKLVNYYLCKCSQPRQYLHSRQRHAMTGDASAVHRQTLLTGLSSTTSSSHMNTQ